VQSSKTLDNGNIGLVMSDGEVRDTGIKEAGRSQIINVPGLGLLRNDPVTGTISEVGSEDVIRGGIADRQLVESEAGRGRVLAPGGEFEAVPGSQADVAEREEKRKLYAGNYMKSIQAQTVVEDVTRLNTQILEDRVPFGRGAAFQEEFLTPALQTDNYRDAQSLIESVKGNVGIDSLLRIKQTGAGLGQVPQSQLDLLSTLLGKLNLSQSKAQFIRTWNRMGDIYDEIWRTADEDMIENEFPPPEIFTRISEGGLTAQDRIDSL